MAEEISKTQIDRLGDRLKKGRIEDNDLRLLDQYRRSYAEAYDAVVGMISRDLSLAPTGRPAKSTSSIVDKLHRESIRLTQIQDIAGCRIVVAGMADQETTIRSLRGLFDDVTIVDRRQQPSHGYRAVHVIVRYSEKLIEIQVRTALQHIWAELSEKLSDVFDPMIKYGGGNETIREVLKLTSDMVIKQETLEMNWFLSSVRLPTVGDTEELHQQRSELEERIHLYRHRTSELLLDGIARMEKLKG